MSSALDMVTRRLDAEFERSVERLAKLLRIPSVSTDPAFRAEVRRAAEFLAEDLTSIGFKVKVNQTPGHPIITAHHDGAGEGAPRILYYGHYDVQPPDPLDQWHSPPFEPTIVDGPRGKRIVARGAVDDKGQVMTFVEAFRAWQAVHGTLPVRVTLLIEGEEESGSPSLDPFLKEHARELAADVAVIVDTGMWDIDTPAVTYMLRGLVYAEVTLHGPAHDLHSGIYGGAVVNPANELARVLGQLKNERGTVQIPHFYDDVRELSPEESAQWKRLPFNEAAFLKSGGVSKPIGEAGRSTLERVWSRPTCDINGIWGGYTGRGAKTVIPSTASAKLSCRLVPDQDPRKVYEGLQAFFKERTPPDCRWEITLHSASPAVRVPTDSPWLDAALKGLESTYNRKPVLIGCGGSIPVVGSIQKILGFESLLVGYGLEDDRVHSPNEKFELRCYQMGQKSQAAILDRFASLRKPAAAPAARSAAKARR